MRILLHGGAGPSSDHPGERQDILDEAAEAGARGDTPKEAVVSAINVLEGWRDSHRQRRRGRFLPQHGVDADLRGM